MIDLTKGNEGKSIFLFALPMLIGGVFQQLYNTADSIIVGRFIGVDAMAAVSGANPIMFLIISLITGITLGFSIIISQYFGAKKDKKVKEAINTTYIFAFFSSIILTIVGIVFTEPILKMINTPENIFLQSRNYLIIIFLGLFFSTGYNTVSAVLRGLGDSKNPLYFLIIATILNIILDVVFIIYFNMGVAGVALATVIAQGASFLFSIIYLNKNHKLLKISIKDISFSKNIFIKGIRLGIPSGIQQMLFSLGNIALQSLVNSFGTVYMAAFGAGMKIESFISLPIINLGAALSTFVAQNIGSQKKHRINKGLKFTIYFSLILAVSVTFIFYKYGDFLISFFNEDIDVITIGHNYLKTIGPFFIFACTGYMYTSTIKGAGASMFALFSSIISLWLGRVPVSYLLSNYIGITGVWLGISTGWTIGFIITYLYYRSNKWDKSII